MTKMSADIGFLIVIACLILGFTLGFIIGYFGRKNDER